jgi:hypothetical protein
MAFDYRPYCIGNMSVFYELTLANFRKQGFEVDGDFANSGNRLFEAMTRSETCRALVLLILSIA